MRQKELLKQMKSYCLELMKEFRGKKIEMFFKPNIGVVYLSLIFNDETYIVGFSKEHIDWMGGIEPTFNEVNIKRMIEETLLDYAKKDRFDKRHDNMFWCSKDDFYVPQQLRFELCRKCELVGKCNGESREVYILTRKRG